MHKPIKNDNLTSTAIKSSVWVYGRIFITSLTGIVVIAILSRQLTPEDFGIVALGKVSMNLLMVLASGGISEFVIYDFNDNYGIRAKAAFWMDFTLALICSTIGFLLISPIITFYDEPRLGIVLVVLLLKLPIDSLTKIPDALLIKKMNFRKLEIRDTIISMLGGGISIIMAINGYGIWSIVIPSLIGSVMRVIIIYSIVLWRPGWNPYIKEWPQIFSYSAPVVGATLTNFFIKEGDTMLIGKLLGSKSLGIYNISWQSSNMFIKLINGVVLRIGFPALSTISNDRSKILSGVQKMLSTIAITAFPLLVGLFVVSDEFILAIYGPKWEEAIWPLRILTIYAIRFAIASPAGIVYKAIGRTDINFKLNTAIVPFYMMAVYFGAIYYGITGVAIGVTLSRSILGLINFKILANCLSTGMVSILRPLYLPFFASLIMGLTVFLAKTIIGMNLIGDHLIKLILLTSIGLITYVLLLRTFYFKSLSNHMLVIIQPLLGDKAIYLNRFLK